MGQRQAPDRLEIRMNKSIGQYRQREKRLTLQSLINRPEGQDVATLQEDEPDIVQGHRGSLYHQSNLLRLAQLPMSPANLPLYPGDVTEESSRVLIYGRYAQLRCCCTLRATVSNTLIIRSDCTGLGTEAYFGLSHVCLGQLHI